MCATGPKHRAWACAQARCSLTKIRFQVFDFGILSFQFSSFNFQFSKIRRFKTSFQNGDIQISIPTSNTCIYSHKLCFVGPQHLTFASRRCLPSASLLVSVGMLQRELLITPMLWLLSLSSINYIIINIICICYCCHFNIILIFCISIIMITITNLCYYYHITIRSIINIKLILKIILDIILSTSLWDLAPN